LATLSRYESLARRRAVRALVTVTVLALWAWALANQWTGFVAAVSQLTPVMAILAAVFIMVGLGLGMGIWKNALSILGAHLTTSAAAETYFLGQMGKYVPGSVWPAVLQAEIAKRYGVSRRQALTGYTSTVLLSLFAATAVGGICWTVVLGGWWWAVSGLPSLMLLGLIASRRGSVAIARATARLANLTPESDSGSVGRGTGWISLATWGVMGAHAALLSADFAPAEPTVWLAAVAGFCLAWVAGTLVVFVPAGIGVREAVLALTLGEAIGVPAAIAVALVSRFLMTLVDLAWASVILVVVRRSIHR
jgi:glycosyltransferase 2 family protein